MTSNEEKIKDNYCMNLKALDYVDYLTKSFNDAPEMLRFFMTFLHDVLKSGRFQGSSLLEIGSGAVVHCIASASAYFPCIVMSDFVEDNCNELRNWLAGKSPIKQLLDVAAELEGYTNDLETGKKLLENRIRKCVKQVVRCDVLSDGVLLEAIAPDVAPPYDLIISIFTLESATSDYDSYLQIYKRVNKLLRPGGGLIICGVFQAKSWKVYETQFHHVDIKQDDLMKALKEGGFGNIDLKTQDKVPIDLDYEQMFCVAAQKM